MTCSDRFSRQTFLGVDAQRIIETCRAAVVGVGGGGSHIVQQLAHLGFRNYVLFDPDIVETSNLNRLVGAQTIDAEANMPKVLVAERVIRALHENASVTTIRQCWSEQAAELKACDVVFGCVDSFAARRDLEVSARRYLLPYIDIGIDVHETTEGPRLVGQVIASIPGEPCMKCMGFLTEENLAREATRYGAAGVRPQVVWANGVLASTAVGLAMDLLTGWSRRPRLPLYLSYDGNDGTMKPHPRLEYLQKGPCPHFPQNAVGDPVLTEV